VCSGGSRSILIARCTPQYKRTHPMPARGRNRAVDSPVWYRAMRRFTHSRWSGAYSAHIYFDEFPVVRRTPQGVWLRVANHGMWRGTAIDPDHKRNLKWVSNDAMKRFAYPTKARAFENLRRRALSYRRHCTTRLAQSNAAIQAVHEYQLEELTDAR
jgi:hypothetical protein